MRMEKAKALIVVFAFLFFAALVGMSVGTAVLMAAGPGGAAGQRQIGLLVAAGLGLMWACAAGLVHVAGELPAGPVRRTHRADSKAGKQTQGVVFHE